MGSRRNPRNNLHVLEASSFSGFKPEHIYTHTAYPHRKGIFRNAIYLHKFTLEASEALESLGA